MLDRPDNALAGFSEDSWEYLQNALSSESSSEPNGAVKIDQNFKRSLKRFIKRQSKPKKTLKYK